MTSSKERISKIEHNLMWAAISWFGLAVASAIGRWLNIDALNFMNTNKQSDVIVWTVFLGLLVLGFMILDCTKAIVAAVQENRGGRP